MASPVVASSQAKNTRGGKRTTSWKPGQSGNPLGRPKVVLPDGRSIADIAREHSGDAMQTLLDALSDDSGKVRTAAANAILDRAFGKPTQPISGDDERPPVQYAVWPVPQHRLEAGK